MYIFIKISTKDNGMMTIRIKKDKKKRKIIHGVKFTRKINKEEE